MKNVKRLKLKFSLPNLLAVLLLFFGLSGFAQAEFAETISMETSINADATVSFTNRSFDVEIKTWNKNAIELQIDVKLKAKDQDDIDKTVEAIRAIEFDGTDSKFFINTLFWESMVSNLNHKIKLITGKKVVLKDFDLKITLFIPKTISIKIDNKYAVIKMDEIAGEADIKIYSGKFYGESIGGDVVFDLRYSKVFLQNVPEATMELYDSDIEMAACGNVNLKSKYSKIEIGLTGDFVFNSYDDKLAIGKLENIDGTAKYSDFEFGLFANLMFDFYDCNLKGGETGNVKGHSKYSEIEITKANDIQLTSSYDDNFVFGEIVSLECSESKYTDFKIEVLNTNFQLQSYDDNVTINAIAPDFSQISIDGKYGDFRLTFSETAVYRLLVDMKYGKVDYPENNFNMKTLIKESSNVFLDATTKNNSKKISGIVEIKGYDNRIFIQD